MSVFLPYSQSSTSVGSPINVTSGGVFLAGVSHSLGCGLTSHVGSCVTHMDASINIGSGNLCALSREHFNCCQISSVTKSPYLPSSVGVPPPDPAVMDIPAGMDSVGVPPPAPVRNRSTPRLPHDLGSAPLQPPSAPEHQLRQHPARSPPDAPSGPLPPVVPPAPRRSVRVILHNKVAGATWLLNRGVPHLTNPLAAKWGGRLLPELLLPFALTSHCQHRRRGRRTLLRERLCSTKP